MANPATLLQTCERMAATFDAAIMAPGHNSPGNEPQNVRDALARFYLTPSTTTGGQAERTRLVGLMTTWLTDLGTTMAGDFATWAAAVVGLDPADSP